MPRRYVPKRGDVVWLHFDPQAGHEQAGRRPAVVLSPETYNQKTSLALFCPVTKRNKGYPFETPLPPASPVSGVALCDQIKDTETGDLRCRTSSRFESGLLEVMVAR